MVAGVLSNHRVHSTHQTKLYRLRSLFFHLWQTGPFHLAVLRDLVTVVGLLLHR
jgi:hypothetical protein